MEKIRMRDMIVLLPGIMGSVLQKDGKDLFALSASAFWGALTSHGDDLQKMKLTAVDDPSLDDLGDGITATRLMPDAHLIPGFFKIDGYGAISRFLTQNFVVTRGQLEDETKPANFFEFPYDWRRDNRVAARKLQRFVERRLKQWRDQTQNKDAKVILVAHSMGGLVSRYYLEVLEGWADCRALITFGTPFRGSANALNFLSNGYKNRLLDLTEVLRSFTSAYQLLPTYKVIQTGGEYLRVGDVDGIPGIDRARAFAAREDFHVKIMDAVESHQADPDYVKNAYRKIPVVGTRQPTLQSATFAAGRLEVNFDVPTDDEATRELMAEGDGTVPRISAVPVELSDEYRETFFAERHASLQNNAQVLEDLYERLKQTQVRTGDLRALQMRRRPSQQPALSVGLEDMYFADEAVSMRAKLVNVEPEDAVAPRARIKPAQTDGPLVERVFQPEGDEWKLEVEPLPAGLYRLEVLTDEDDPTAPLPVHDIFEVQG